MQYSKMLNWRVNFAVVMIWHTLATPSINNNFAISSIKHFLKCINHSMSLYWDCSLWILDMLVFVYLKCQRIIFFKWKERIKVIIRLKEIHGDHHGREIDMFAKNIEHIKHYISLMICLLMNSTLWKSSLN